jgi:hypothetical protein
MTLDEGSDNCGIDEAKPIGEAIYIDDKENTFYQSLMWKGFTVVIGAYIKVQLAHPDPDGETLGVALVTAIFFDNTNDRELFLEVKWFSKPKELELSKKKLSRIGWIRNELVEMEIFDEIPAESVISLVSVLPDDSGVSLTSPSRQTFTSKYFYDQVDFICRFLFSEDSLSVHPIIVTESIQRALQTSAYGHIYAPSHAAAVEDYTVANDIYASAIRTLDLSVLPTHFPCRAEERNAIEAFIRRGIQSRGGIAPIYISGLPGTGESPPILNDKCLYEPL